MANTIDVTERGSNRKLSLVVSNILHVEHFEVDGQPLTIITLVGDKTIWVTENIVNVKGQINRAN